LIRLALLFSLVLVKSPTLFGDHPPQWAQAMPPAILLGVAAIATPGMRLRASAGRALLVATLALLFSISYLRAAQADSVYSQKSATIAAITLMALTVFGFIAMLEETDDRERYARLRALLYAPCVYVALNIALHIAHIGSKHTLLDGSNIGEAQILSFIGFAQQRVVFPMAGGLNDFGVIAGLAATTSLVLLWMDRGRRGIPALAFAASVFALLLVDSRGPVVFALVAAFLSVYALRFTIGLPLLVPIAPAFVLTAVGYLADSSSVGVFSRASGDFSTATGRSDVWGQVFSFLTGDADFGHLMIGWGGFGHLTSTVSYSYAYVFGRQSPELATSHSFVLQTILDIGVAGVLVAIAVMIGGLWRAMVRARETHASPDHALLAALTFIGLAGFTEATPSIYMLDTLSMFLMIGFAAAYRFEPATAPSRVTTRMLPSAAR
jgi:O-antigen ligase